MPTTRARDKDGTDHIWAKGFCTFKVPGVATVGAKNKCNAALVWTDGISGNNGIAKAKVGVTALSEFCLGEDCDVNAHQVQGTKRLNETRGTGSDNVESRKLNNNW